MCNDITFSNTPNTINNNNTSYAYSTAKHKYVFNTTEDKEALANTIVNILVSSILSSSDKMIT